MSKDIIAMKYDQVDQMIKVLRNGAEQLDVTLNQIGKIIQILEEGALTGDGGTAFQGALKEKLHPSIIRLKSKLLEVAKDIITAKYILQGEVDPSAASKFK